MTTIQYLIDKYSSRSEELTSISADEVLADLKALGDHSRQQSIAFNQYVSGYERMVEAKKFLQVKTDDEVYEKFLEHQSRLK